MPSVPGAPKKNKRKRKRRQNLHENHQNPYGRNHEPDKAGHVLVTEEDDGEILFSQFPVESKVVREVILSTPPKNPKSRREPQFKSKQLPDDLKAVREHFPFDVTTPQGTKLRSARSLDIVTTVKGKPPKKSLLLFFSPKRRTNGDDIHQKNVVVIHQLRKRKGDNEVGKLPPKNVLEKGKLGKSKPRDDGPEQVDINHEPKKGGGPVHLYFKTKRKGPRKGNQNEVMGRSANEELLAYVKKNKENYSSQKLAVLTELAKNFKMEWLHCLGFSLCPKKYEAQSKENLGAGPKWINTYMMVLEGLAKHFIEKHPTLEKIIKPTFILFPKSDVVEKVEYEVTVVTEEGTTITFSDSINALELPTASNWPSTTDAVQVKAVAEAMLSDTPPRCEKRLSVV